jgi:acetyl-CoA C-acetyltransferase
MSGTSNNVLVIGVEKMSDVSIDMATTGLTGASDEEWEAYYGATFPSLYAMIARAHMNKYKTTKEQLALTAVKNHQNATLNPKAHFRKPITVEEVIRAPMVADPLGLYDCSPISDGAAAIILSNKHKKGAQLLSIEQAQASIALHDRNDITKLEATIQAAGKAYTKTNLKPTDISIMEVHDCFTIAEICAYEDLGLVEKGKGGQLIESGKVNIDGSIPVNTSGGLKAAGHPVGATGIKQAVEIISQLSGNAKERQVKHDLKYGLTHNVGGSGATCVVGIWGKI